jgi:intracellular sulfur oxidation DsrE/DsrF family protein
LPHALFQPEKGRIYRATADVTRMSEDVREPAPGFTHAARAYNVYQSAGLDTRTSLKLIVVVHGPATTAVMNDEVYTNRYETANPNSELLRRLAEAGAELYVCGQALCDQGYKHEQVLPEVRVALSALSVLIASQNEGYAVLPY